MATYPHFQSFTIFRAMVPVLRIVSRAQGPCPLGYKDKSEGHHGDLERARPAQGGTCYGPVSWGGPGPVSQQLLPSLGRQGRRRAFQGATASLLVSVKRIHPPKCGISAILPRLESTRTSGSPTPDIHSAVPASPCFTE